MATRFDLLPSARPARGDGFTGRLPWGGVIGISGRDPQLERAVEVILKRMEADPRRLPARPADPVKTPEATRR
ncbi:MAG TPA: hypothetical protein VNB06_00080 [Thermoanaerobaculia bacterium]|nr:hypothetical protein [Thermoanaerobaculia bacterium]